MISNSINENVDVDLWRFLGDWYVKEYNNDLFKSDNHVHLNIFNEFPRVF
jgi:hypothetical protein